MKSYCTTFTLCLCLCFPLNFCKAQTPIVMEKPQNPSAIKLFLCGDVMTGRGIDQVLPQSVDPVLYEDYVKDAGDYVILAEKENGPIKKPVSYDYIWGDAVEIWQENAPQHKLINLETSVTTHDKSWPGKGIQYRMHPENIRALTTVGIDHVSLANNHSLDWNREGLDETMKTLKNAGIAFSGAGKNKDEAAKPSVLKSQNNRILVFSYGILSSGIPPAWAATRNRSGVNFLPTFDERSIQNIKEQIKKYKKKGDIIIFSIHWGGNWGYKIPPGHREFARQLIDEAGIDLIYGHSSHHPLGIEVYREKLIIYGAGDFINDYEGISGHEEYRGDLTLMYFPEINSKTGTLNSLKMVPMQVKNFRLNKASGKDAKWLQNVLTREGKDLGTLAKINKHHQLWLDW